MDERMKELIAIGVSVGVHCQPCLDFHLGKARDLGIGEDEIKEAVEVGHMVEKGALNAMRKHVSLVLNKVQTQGGACCPGDKSRCCS
ncbi:MAG: carboxymuconolactone decarboxylase family protein [Dehalobacter sp.]|nr:carboxymuconolactone decarboxylase family protein [Dehalobacter sp.]